MFKLVASTAVIIAIVGCLTACGDNQREPDPEVARELKEFRREYVELDKDLKKFRRDYSDILERLEKKLEHLPPVNSGADSGAAEGLQALANDSNVKVKVAAQLALEKNKE